MPEISYNDAKEHALLFSQLLREGTVAHREKTPFPSELTLTVLKELGYETTAPQIIEAFGIIEERIAQERRQPKLRASKYSFESWLRKIADAHPNYGFEITKDGKLVLRPAEPDAEKEGLFMRHYGILVETSERRSIDQVARARESGIWGNPNMPTYLSPDLKSGVRTYGGSRSDAVWVTLKIDTSILRKLRDIFHDPEMLRPNDHEKSMKDDLPGKAYWVPNGIPIEAIVGFENVRTMTRFSK